MEISKKSWHYRFLRFIVGSEKMECGMSFYKYFWLIVISFLILALLGTVVVGYLIFIFYNLVLGYYSNPMSFLSIAGIAFGFLSAVILAIWFVINISDISNYLESKIELYRLLKIRYESFKEKHCPIVNFKE